MHVDFLHKQVRRQGQLIELSPKEFHLLQHLVTNRRTIQFRGDLLREVWGYKVQTTRTLDVHIAGLRQKLEEYPRYPRYIITVRRKGYVFRD